MTLFHEIELWGLDQWRPSLMVCRLFAPLFRGALFF